MKTLLQVFPDGQARIDELLTVALTGPGFERGGYGPDLLYLFGKLKPHSADRLLPVSRSGSNERGLQAVQAPSESVRVMKGVAHPSVHRRHGAAVSKKIFMMLDSKDNGLFFHIRKRITSHDLPGRGCGPGGMVELRGMNVMDEPGQLGQQGPSLDLYRIPSPSFHEDQGSRIDGHLFRVLDPVTHVALKIGEHIVFATPHKGIGEKKGLADAVVFLKIQVKVDP
jgi:hypothetical protein